MERLFKKSRKQEALSRIKGSAISDVNKDIVYRIDGISYIVKSHYEEKGEDLLTKIGRLVSEDAQLAT